MKKSLSLLVLMSLVFIGFISASICEDNDGGIYYQSRGTATFIHPDTGSESVETDYCMMDNKTLYERYCEEDYKIGLDIYECEHGCMNGECIIHENDINESNYAAYGSVVQC